MNAKILLGGMALAGSTLLFGCNGASNHPATMAPTSQTLSTQQVLDMAKTTSETSDPVPVITGALVVTPADDQSSDPIAVS
jgi:hypothetical protein